MKKKISLMLVTILIMQILLPLASVVWESRFTIISKATGISKEWDVSQNEDGTIIAKLYEDGTLVVSGTGDIKSSFSKPAFSNKNIKRVIIENGISSITEYAFKGCENLISVDIADTVTQIGDAAFRDCYNLRNIKWGAGLETIGTEAFKGCNYLKNIELPQGIKKISRAAFSNCLNLRNITIPESVIMIGQNDDKKYGTYQMDVFRGSGKLENIIVDENNTNYLSDNGILFNKDKTVVICYPEGKNDEEYTLSNTVDQIGSFSFYNSKLKAINIDNNCTKIRDGAFYMCNSLENITVPDNCIDIETPANVFYGCNNLKRIDVSQNNLKYASNNGILFNKEKTNIIRCPANKEGENYIIPNTVQEIEMGAFANCINLKNITIPESVTKINGFAFMNCINLEEIIIPNSVKIMGTSLYGFGIGYVFEGCTNLKKAILPKQLDDFYSDYDFAGCINLRDIQLPENTEYLGRYIFASCIQLNNLTLPNSIKKIGDSAFSNCANLTTINLPTSLTQIGDFSFSGTNLENIEVPENITSIGLGAFMKCRNIKNISILKDDFQISSRVFEESCLIVKIDTNSEETYEIELPDIIKKTMDPTNILYSNTGLRLTNCSLNEDKTKVIVSKAALDNSNAYFEVRDGKLYGLKVNFESSSYKDEINPTITQVNLNVSDKTLYKEGEKIAIRIRTSEIVKGEPPILKIKIGESDEKECKISNTYNWNTGSGTEIEYSYTVSQGDNGLLKVVSIDGGNLTDFSGNQLITDNFTNSNQEIMINTMEMGEDVFKSEYHVNNKEDLINIRMLNNSRIIRL